MELAKILEKNNWAADASPYGLWAVGPEMTDGSLNILGLGRTLEDACTMALKTKEHS